MNGYLATRFAPSNSMRPSAKLWRRQPFSLGSGVYIIKVTFAALFV